MAIPGWSKAKFLSFFPGTNALKHLLISRPGEYFCEGNPKNAPAKIKAPPRVTRRGISKK